MTLAAFQKVQLQCFFNKQYTIVYNRGLKHAARRPHVARQMHLCGPRTPQKNAKSIMFDQIKPIFRAFLVYCGPQKLFSYKLRPAEHFISRMWPSYQFEFETPGIQSPQKCSLCHFFQQALAQQTVNWNQMISYQKIA